MHDGQVDQCVDSLHRVSAMYTRMGAARDALQTTMIAHILSVYGGYIDSAYPALLSCIADAERLEARYVAQWARWGSALSLLIAGDRAAAEVVLAQSSAIIDGQPLFRDVTTLFRAWAAFAAEDDEKLGQIVDAGIPMLSYGRFRAAFAGFAAYARLRRGDTQAACDDARTALAVLATAPGIHADGCIAGYTPALATLVQAATPDAAAAVAEHVARIEATAATLATDEARDRYKNRVPWTRRVLDMHQRLRIST